MNIIIFGLFACLLVGCGGMKPVEGVPEMQLESGKTATVTEQPDGSRLVTVSQGEIVIAIILLPPLPAKQATITVPNDGKVEK